MSSSEKVLVLEFVMSHVVACLLSLHTRFSGLPRFMQGFGVMSTVYPTQPGGSTELPGQHSGAMRERVLLPIFEQAFIDAVAVGASGGFGADCWFHFDWIMDVPDISMAAIASRSVFGALS